LIRYNLGIIYGGIMKIKTFFLALTMLGVLNCCAQTNTASLVSDIKTPNDHDAVVKHFEDVAKEMQVKQEEQEKLLEHYEAKSYLYGRQAQDLKSHCQALVRNYRQAAEEANANLANVRQEMAATHPSSANHTIYSESQ
jgi:hypothetical protein